MPIGWDVFDNFHSITTENKDYSKIVLSLNPNNEFFLFMMYYLNKFLRFIDVTGAGAILGLVGKWLIACLLIAVYFSFIMPLSVSLIH